MVNVNSLLDTEQEEEGRGKWEEERRIAQPHSKSLLYELVNVTSSHHCMTYT